MVNDIIIELNYSYDGNIYNKIKLLAEDYFDLTIGEEPDIDSTPKFLELKDYLPEKSDRCDIMLAITNLNNSKSMKVYEKMWKGNHFSYTQEFVSEKNICSEIILQIEESSKENLQTVKFYINADKMHLVTHSLYNLKEDSSDSLI